MLDPIQLKIGKIYKAESGRVLASLIRILGDLDLAEEALQDAFSVAMQKWPIDGLPKNPYSWLVSTGKFKAIDMIRRVGRGKELLVEKMYLDEEEFNENSSDYVNYEKHLIEDDQLRLIFFCCNPLLPMDSRIALALRDVCGMSTAEIAKAFLLPVETIKKRISRAKALIKEKNIPYDIPSKVELVERVNAALAVIYLVFNEGYAASSGESHIRRELTEEAIFLSRQLMELVATPESIGLLALMLLQESRRQARVTNVGDIIPLDEQDRSLWDQALIREGVLLIETAVMSGRLGSYTLQAAIASVHALADSVQNTQWQLIIDYYDMLLSINPSPVVELNRAIAVGMLEGPEVGLALLEGLLEDKKLSSYHTIYAVQADFYKKLRLFDKAINAYQRAIELVRQEPEKRYLNKQLADIS